MRHLVLATRSAGKLRELGPLCRAAGYNVLTLDDAGLAEDARVEAQLECWATFEANARAKARYFGQRLNAMVLADDSGLCVDALHGAPGVHSKRWLGRDDLEGLALDEANVSGLLARMAGVTERAARYSCAAVVWAPEGECVGFGETEGRILEDRRGSGGFGYDPVFWSTELGQTFAEATMESKVLVSHRGRAVRSVLGQAVDIGGPGSTIPGPIGA